MRRLPFRHRRARQRHALRRAAQRDDDHVHRLPWHDRSTANADHLGQRRSDRSAQQQQHAVGAALSSGKAAKLYQQSIMSPDVRWEIPQTIDTIDPLSLALQSEVGLRQNAAARRQNMGRVAGGADSGGTAKTRPPGSAPSYTERRVNSRTTTAAMDCQICHTSWATSCFGCHLPMKANQRVPKTNSKASPIGTSPPTIRRSCATTCSCSASTAR